MSDDLVKRLRNTPNWMREGFQDWKNNVRTYDRAPFEAADRIEELEKVCDEWAEVSQSNYQRAKAAEAKLAKAEVLMFAGFAEYERRLAKAMQVVEMIASADVDAVLGQAVDLSCEIIGELMEDE